MSDIERSESGAPIYRHTERKREWQLPAHPAAHLEEIETHLEKYLGKIETVFHEIFSDIVHLDVLMLPASGDKPFHTLVTSGVSDKPMQVPEGLEQFARVELMIHLPADWPLDEESFKQEKHYWPVRWLKQIGRLPHEFETWLGWGHTIPNGDPPEPIADTDFIGFMLTPPYWFDPELFQLKTSGGETILFYNLVPLYAEEMDLKLAKGAEVLEDLFEQRGIGPVVDVNRENVAVF
ncbi:MAG: hypothetical protein KatS3mg105_2740 [Gemmatales bacterium]|nr:MAG: hypothetical protein KatS3mg105_2740 [Gemmatales bacterium]